ncbi:MAG: hypothetical protein ACREA9_05100 [Pyrinomonadaceae bacterium]
MERQPPAFSPDAPLDGDLREALSKAGFKEDLSGESTPPVSDDEEVSDGPPYRRIGLTGREGPAEGKAAV